MGGVITPFGHERKEDVFRMDDGVLWEVGVSKALLQTYCLRRQL